MVLGSLVREKGNESERISTIGVRNDWPPVRTIRNRGDDVGSLDTDIILRSRGLLELFWSVEAFDKAGRGGLEGK